MKKIVLLVLAAGIVLSSFSSADAWGITSPYWDENPLTLSPGDSRDFTLLLQNMVGGENIKIEATLIRGAEIAKIIDSNTVYVVPFGRKDIPVSLQVSIPANSGANQKYEVELNFIELSEVEGGMVKVTSSITKKIPVVVASESIPELEFARKPGRPYSFWADSGVMIMVFAVIVIAIAIFVLRKPQAARRRR